MSFPVTPDQPTYPTRRTNPYDDDDDSCNVPPAPSNPPQHHLELGPPQRRRVNPESLAARLGPELVAEMEKHIIPGSIEMPPFSVRRDIQIKFGIDRRHIYDFFHSRGLRCLNEKTMRNSYLETKSQRPARNTIAPPPTFPEPRKRRAAAAASEAASLKYMHPPRKPRGRQKRPERPPSPSGLDSTYPHENHFLLEPEPEIPDVDSRMAEMAQESLPSSDADASSWMSDVSCSHFLEQFSTFVSEEEETEPDLSPCHSVLSLPDLSSSVSTSTLSPSSSMSSTLSSTCETTDLRPRAVPLSSQERQAHYAWLDGIIGPASGIQESMGTYKAFMEHQREVYYDRLLLMAEQPSKVAASRRAGNEFISWVRSTHTSGMPPVHWSPSSVVTAPQLEFKFTRLATTPSASNCCPSPGSSLPVRTDVDTCRYSKTQAMPVAEAVSVPVPQLGTTRLPCPIPEWTRHPRRRTFSATGDM